MKGDFSRRTFDASKHYSALLVEQGRLLTDADSEEQHRILTYRTEHAAEDIIGACGGPLLHAGFGLSILRDGQLGIGAGPYYAAGVLLENEFNVAYARPLAGQVSDQPDRFDVRWPLPRGRHAVLLHSWRRLITALDDPSIREVALGGPTTSSRERVVWQVGTVPVEVDWVCTDELPAAEQTTGELAARAEPDQELSSPCLIPPQAGYTGLENQLYRVEIFDSGEAYDLEAAPGTLAITGFPAGQPNQLTVAALGSLAVDDAVEVYRAGSPVESVEATFGYVTDIDNLTLTLSTSLPAFGPTDVPTLRKVDAAFVVSRDNGSVVTTIETIDGVEVTVHDMGPDDVLGFAVGQLVEISDDRIELEGKPRRLHQIADIDRARGIIVLRTPARALDADPSGVDSSRHPKLRRWDAAGAVRFLPDGKGWIHLENGNQVRFAEGHYRSGDYWAFPARAATVDADSGTIDWPQKEGAPALRFPFGIERHRCVLGFIDVDAQGAITRIEDCRNLFPPLTSMRNLLYVGGDGQEGSSSDAVGRFIPLPGRPEVRVANGGFPVAGATVRFTLVAPGAGRLEGAGATANLTTDGDGLASCSWEIDTTEEHQVCIAQLLAPSGDPVPHQVVRFHATIDRDEAGGSCCWSVGPGGDFPTLDEALKGLLGRGERDVCLCLMSGDHKFDGGTLEVASEKMQMRLSIHGCGRGARLHIAERWQIGAWIAVRLVDFDMFLAPDAFIQLIDVADVELSGCRIFGLRPDGALLGVHGFDRLHVIGNVLVLRRRDTFDGPRRFLDGLSPLDLPWKFLDEGAVRNATFEAARELSDMSAAAREALVKVLRGRIELARDVISRGEVDALTRLADKLESDPRWPALAEVLDLVGRAATVARGGVALEVGASEVDQQVEAPSRVSVVMADNVIPGVVTFYGRGEEGFVVEDQTLKRLRSIEGAPILGTAGDVHIRDNRLSRVALSAGMIRLLEDLIQNPRPLSAAYESFHVTNNVIDAAVSQIVARHTSMTSNDFTLNALPANEVPPNGVVADVIGDNATYIGNRGPTAGAAPIIVRDSTRNHAEAANLELQVIQFF